MPWLNTLLAAIPGDPLPRPLFIRDDDGGWDDTALWRLLDLMERREVPIDVAVIPDAVSTDLTRELRARVTAGSGVAVHQHGMSHRNHETTGRPCEFGGSRPLRAQRDDIRRGRQRLDDQFDGLARPVFTPPWNRCVRGTADLLWREGFRVLSRDVGAPAFDTGLQEVGVSIDWARKVKGRRVDREEIVRRALPALRTTRPIGLMLHHAVMTDGDFTDLDRLLGTLRASGQVAFCHIEDVVN